ncbi:MAG: tetratricopeptide repeat protein [Phormidesmis sp.]
MIHFSQHATSTTPAAVPASKLTELYIHRGNAYRQLGHHHHAAADLEEGVVRSGGSAQSYACRGLLKLDIEDFAGAIADFTQALQIHPTFAQCHLWRGCAHLRNHHPSEAADDLSRAIEAIPTSPEAYNHRGVANFYLSRFEVALSDFDQAIRLNPKFAEAYSNRGTLRRLMGDIAAADVDCDRALTLNPALQDALQDFLKVSETPQRPPHTAHEHYLHGIAHTKRSRFTNALQHFDSAIAISPDYTAPYIERCLTHFLARQPSAALEDFERIINRFQLSHPPKPQKHPHQ